MRLLQQNVKEVKPGDTRLVIKFAWLPLFIGKRVIWLERYESLELYTEMVYNVMIESKSVLFSVCNWIEISKRLKN